jgi:hypothetical protein
MSTTPPPGRNAVVDYDVAHYTARYDEDGEVVWFPRFSRAGVPLSRGKAQAAAASEWGTDFVAVRVRVVWMTTDPERDGWSPDMLWECPADAPDALPYWRCDYIGWAP